jgi:hypothetical protein
MPTPLLLVTRDESLRERVLLLCAAAGVDADVVEQVDDARSRWRAAPGVLLDPVSCPVEGGPGLLARR